MRFHNSLLDSLVGSPRTVLVLLVVVLVVAVTHALCPVRRSRRGPPLSRFPFCILAPTDHVPTTIRSREHPRPCHGPRTISEGR
uniref:Uncharacterized protein n=1 Tax=Ixodes ricinus TaxID=34613 RepID=A0A6B0TXX7_IXORI